jgi:hypothetical protein
MNGLNQVISGDSWRRNPGNLRDGDLPLGGAFESVEDGCDKRI